MNILLLTPDAVGGTLLNRTLTIFMQWHEFGKPVIEVGHIELGLEKFYSTDFNQEILHPSHNKKFQTLSEITELLESVNHYKIAKLPHYNMLSRKDPMDQQFPFYHYLNENYFIISCRRENIFDHSLSWSLNKITKALNVYNNQEKIEKFAYFYKNKVKIDPISLIQSLEDYLRYIRWCEDHFKIASYYSYETHSPNIENYILSLPMFAEQKQLHRWKDIFDQEFNDWNRCHYFLGDLTPLALDSRAVPLCLEDFSDKSVKKISDQEIVNEMLKHWKKFVYEYNKVADPAWPKLHRFEDYDRLPQHIKDECRNMHHITWELDMVQKRINMLHDKYDRPVVIRPSQNNLNKLQNYLAEQHNDFLSQHREKYQLATQSIEKMKTLGILRQTVPIKKQTLVEKQLIIQNFDECLQTYNDWIVKNPECGSVITDKELLMYNNSEQAFWNSIHNKKLYLNKS